MVIVAVMLRVLLSIGLFVRATGVTVVSVASCPDYQLGCGGSYHPTASVGDNCTSPCEDHNGAWYCMAQHSLWGWCAAPEGHGTACDTWPIDDHEYSCSADGGAWQALSGTDEASCQRSCNTQANPIVGGVCCYFRPVDSAMGLLAGCWMKAGAAAVPMAGTGGKATVCRSACTTSTQCIYSQAPTCAGGQCQACSAFTTSETCPGADCNWDGDSCETGGLVDVCADDNSCLHTRNWDTHGNCSDNVARCNDHADMAECCPSSCGLCPACSSFTTSASCPSSYCDWDGDSCETEATPVPTPAPACSSFATSESCPSSYCDWDGNSCETGECADHSMCLRNLGWGAGCSYNAGYCGDAQYGWAMADCCPETCGLCQASATCAGVTLIEHSSGSNCTSGNTFGCDGGDAMFVSDGCSGKLSCNGATVECSSWAHEWWGDARTTCSCQVTCATYRCPPGMVLKANAEGIIGNIWEQCCELPAPRRLRGWRAHSGN